VEVDSAGFYAAFERHWVGLRSRFFKLEPLQAYQEPDNPSFLDFRRGDSASAAAKLEEVVCQNSRYHTDACRRGVTMTRVRLVELPLSDYLRWEFQSYRVSARYGERILVLDLTGAPRSGPLWNSGDFVLFDCSAVLVHRYDPDGFLRGGWLIDHPAAVEGYVRLAEACLPACMPLGLFERQQGLSSPTASASGGAEQTGGRHG
jgi:hypothetical protein